MNDCLQRSTRLPQGAVPVAACFLLPLLLGLLAVTGRSFWIDECVTAQYVSQPTFSEWRRDMLTTDYAEAQMPLYLLYLWGWEKVFGHGEWSLRMGALPWFVAGTGLLLLAWRSSGGCLGDETVSRDEEPWRRRSSQRGAAVFKPPASLCGTGKSRQPADGTVRATWRFLGRAGWAGLAVVGSSAFVWYYLNEARLYAMQFGVACAVTASLVMLACSREPEERGQRRWFVLFLISLTVLSGTSIIGMLWAGAAVLVLAIVLPPARLWARVRSAPFQAIGVFVFLCLLGGYYLETVTRGARASSLATTDVQTTLYVGYELLGFTGLGPGRDALREQGAAALKGYLPVAGLFGLMVSIVFLAGLVALGRGVSRGKTFWVCVAVSLPALFLLATGVLRHFRVLGRHCTPLLPALMLVLVVGLMWLWSRGGWGRTVAALYVALALLSAVQVRVAPRHLKDDYRTAARLASEKLAEGCRVWWAAAPQGAAYYGLPLSEAADDPGAAYAVFGQRAEVLEDQSRPDLLLLSRPDIYDHLGGLETVLNRGRYQRVTNFPGFTVMAPER